MIKNITVKIKELGIGGQGIGEYKNKEARIWNSLPRETVEAEIFKKRRGYLEGVAQNIQEKSADRVDPLDDTFLIHSPWQIMPYEKEIEWKKELTRKVFKKEGIDIPDFKMVFDKEIFGYRNKMEFSFAPDRHGKTSLALFKRGRKNKVAIDGSILADDIINRAGGAIVEWLGKIKIDCDILKSVIIRSNKAGEAVVGLFVKEKIVVNPDPVFPDFIRGFFVYHSEPKSPASVPTELIYRQGDNFLIENLLGTSLKYDFLSFFQVNIPLFEKTLKTIKNFISKKSDIVDFYSGVGAIALPLSRYFKSGILVESNASAADFSEENIKLNKIKNCKSVNERSEKALKYIGGEATKAPPAKIIIVDPPRPGLHHGVIEEILKSNPGKIIYLSCNIETQARDIKKLINRYRISFMEIYNYFPRTPHIESLCVLDIKPVK